VPPTLIVQLSDPHIRLDDDASQPALARAAERVLALSPAPVAVLVTGDIANTGDPAEHERARALLAPIHAPIHTAAGNHDLLGARHEYVIEAGGVRIVVCDTSIPGRDDGSLDVEWLAAQLEPDVPTIVAMHHPPILVGLPWLDRIGLPEDQRAALGELLRANPQVKRVVAGHVHRAASDVLGGCGVVTCASTNIASELDFATPEMRLANEPPSLLVPALLDSGDLITHVQPI
jgi:3',5'-cyclic AMP phosphodiesterase CpdA